MSRYYFDGKFTDHSWNGLPSPDEVKESVAEAIRGSRSDVWKIEVPRVEVTDFGSDDPQWIPGYQPVSDVTVYWETRDPEDAA